MPMSFPYIFEDPYIATSANLVGIWHQFPRDSVMSQNKDLSGSSVGTADIGVIALQLRLAITEKLAFIATKDGIGFLNTEGDSIINDDTGFFNVAAGFKYAAWQWREGNASAIVTPSLRYEIPLGNRDVFQGAGDGILIPAVSTAYQNGNWHVIAGLGGHAPIDDDKNGSNIFYNLHVDHAFPTGNETVPFVVPFIELSGIVYTGNGDGSQKVNSKAGTLPVGVATSALGLSPFEGADVVNLGQDNVRGNDIMTMAWGVRLPIRDCLSLGVSYEIPISNRKDIFEQRVTTMLTWEM
jgi:hypothetical protein